MALQELKIEEGRKYRGSAWVNRYGEMHFRPEQKGSKPGNYHLVAENDVFSLCVSKNLFKVTIKVVKKDFCFAHVTNLFLLTIRQIKEYMR